MRVHPNTLSLHSCTLWDRNPGTKPATAIVSPVMAVNPDPKPGRWILPLVILAMIAFTYFFVSALPEASPDTTLVAGPTDTTVPDTTDTTEPDGNGGDVDDTTQAYLDELNAINAALQVLDTEMIAVSDGFDADPREIEYSDAESRLEVVANDTRALADQVTALTVPAGLENNHQSVSLAIEFCAEAAAETLAGIRSSDTGQLRRAAMAAYTSSAGDFDTEVQNTNSAAGAV